MLEFITLFDQVRLSEFNPLFQVFLTIGFVVFATKKTIPWISDMYSNFLIHQSELKLFKEEVAINNSDKVENEVRVKRVKAIKDKIDEFVRIEKILKEASRIDFLQLGLLTFAFLLMATAESAIYNNFGENIFLFILLVLNFVSVLCFLNRFFSPRRGRGKLFNRGAIQFKVLRKKILFLVFVLSAMGIVISMISGHYLDIHLFYTPKLVIFILVVFNLIYPFIGIFLRGNKFSNYSFRKFKAKVLAINA